MSTKKNQKDKIKVLSFSVMAPAESDCVRCLEEKCYKNERSSEGIFYCPWLQEVMKMSDNLFIILDKWS